MTGQVVLITGAASGIGRAAVGLYAERGHRVIAVDIDADPLSTLAAEGQVLTFAGDVATADANEEAVRLALSTFGRLDAAVLNAGVGGGGPLEGPSAVENFDLGPFLIRRIPQQRWADPREQAEVLWFLTSPAASYITGATIPVDGGLSANGGILLPPALEHEANQ
jgi:NAD(P)-dependent dehydrogenase (short-subunit alcohol dehydrogenase family)